LLGILASRLVLADNARSWVGKNYGVRDDSRGSRTKDDVTRI
jgi:hypothetical protein